MDHCGKFYLYANFSQLWQFPLCYQWQPDFLSSFSEVLLFLCVSLVAPFSSYFLLLLLYFSSPVFRKPDGWCISLCAGLLLALSSAPPPISYHFSCGTDLNSLEVCCEVRRPTLPVTAQKDDGRTNEGDSHQRPNQWKESFRKSPNANSDARCWQDNFCNRKW